MILSALVMAAFFSFLFYRQAIMHGGEYLSDLPTQINIALTQKTSSILFLFMKKLLELTAYNLYFIGLLEGMMTAFTWICTVLFLRRHFRFRPITCRVVSFGLLFLTTIVIPVLFKRFYSGSIVTQPWQNIAYSAMRPFAVLTMYYFVDLIKVYCEEKRIEWKYFVLTSLMALCATAMKPGFMMSFTPALLIFVVVSLVQKQNSVVNGILLCLTAVPSLVLMLIQYLILKGSAAAEPYTIVFGPSMFFFGEGIRLFVMRFISGLCLPVIVYLHNRKKLQPDALFTVVAYLFALLEGMFFVEGGDRLGSGNFLWGIPIFAYILFIYTVSMFIRDAVDIAKTDRPTKQEKSYTIAGAILILLHLICGAGYYVWLMVGNYFYV